MSQPLDNAEAQYMHEETAKRAAREHDLIAAEKALHAAARAYAKACVPDLKASVQDMGYDEIQAGASEWMSRQSLEHAAKAYAKVYGPENS